MSRHIYLVMRRGGVMERHWAVVKGPNYPLRSSVSPTIVSKHDEKRPAVSRASKLVRNTGARGRLEYRYTRVRHGVKVAKAVGNPKQNIEGGQLILFTYPSRVSDDEPHDQPALIDSHAKDMRSNAHFYASSAGKVVMTADNMVEKLGYSDVTMTGSFKKRLNSTLSLSRSPEQRKKLRSAMSRMGL